MAKTLTKALSAWFLWHLSYQTWWRIHLSREPSRSSKRALFSLTRDWVHLLSLMKIWTPSCSSLIVIQLNLSGIYGSNSNSRQQIEFLVLALLTRIMCASTYVFPMLLSKTSMPRFRRLLENKMSLLPRRQRNNLLKVLKTSLEKLVKLAHAVKSLSPWRIIPPILNPTTLRTEVNLPTLPLIGSCMRLLWSTIQCRNSTSSREKQVT